MNSDPFKQAWQSTIEVAGAPSLEDVRAGADKFYHFVKRRNFIEYAACALACVVFGAYVFWLPHLLQKVGSALVVVATIYAARQLHRRASAVAPETAGTMPILVFARAQLARHRDALRSIFWWYLLPFVPGLALIVLGSASAHAGETMKVATPGLAPLAVMTLAGAVFASVWWLNQRIANKLQRYIDEIDALTEEDE